MSPDPCALALNKLSLERRRPSRF